MLQEHHWIRNGGFDLKDSQLKCSLVIIWMFVIDLMYQRIQFTGVSLCIQRLSRKLFIYIYTYIYCKKMYSCIAHSFTYLFSLKILCVEVYDNMNWGIISSLVFTYINGHLSVKMFHHNCKWFFIALCVCM